MSARTAASSDARRPAPEAPSAPRETSTDPRLQEIDRLRAAPDASPETKRVLDAQAVRIKRELAAGRAAKVRETEADALERAASSTFEPTVRNALRARANELRGVAIPTGEAREVNPATGAAPAAGKPLPAGQAAELTPSQADALLPTRREAELQRLRAEVTDPAVLKELDRDIAAERRRASDAAKAAEYLRLAERATDPEVRADFEARAKRLGAKEVEPIPTAETTDLDVQTVEAAPAPAGAFDLPETEIKAWSSKWGFGSLDADAALDVRSARRYDADAVERAAEQHARSPVAFGRAVARIIEEGKARASETERAAGGSERPGSQGKGLGGEDGQRPDGAGPGEEGGGPGVRPGNPDRSGDGGGAARAEDDLGQPESLGDASRPAIGGAIGGDAEVLTERGMRVPVRYRLVNVDDLVASHNNDLSPDPRFDKTLQPRDRDRAASEMQIARMQQALQPDLLGESKKASDGAPIISRDGTVLSGNARTIAIRRAYLAHDARQNTAMPSRNKASGKRDGPPDASKKTVKLTRQLLEAGKSFVASIEALAESNGTVFIRWSPGAKADLSGPQRSRDFVAGHEHDGLSAVEVSASDHPLDIAKSLAEYGFLRMQDKKSVPHVYAAKRVGTDSDGHALIKPTRLLSETPQDVLRAIDLRFHEAWDALDDVERLTTRAEGASGAARQILNDRIKDAQNRLGGLLESEDVAPSTSGARSTVYRQWLAANAERFGLSPGQVWEMDRPVLVREHTVAIDRADFARQANESPVASMSETEQAFADAKNLPDLEKLDTNEDGAINLARSADFVRQFMHGVSEADRGQLMTAEGRPSQRLASRIRNAVFAHAYGDADLVARMAEATDGNTRNLLAGFMRAAPDVARLRELSEAGARPKAEFVGDLLEAAQRYIALREQGLSVADGESQGSLIGGEAKPSVAALMRELEVDARAPRRVAETIRRLVDEVDRRGDPRQSSMFSEEGDK